MRIRFGLGAVLVLLAMTLSAQEFGPWSTPVSLGSTINTSFADFHPSLSKDGLTMIFSSTRPRPDGSLNGIDLWVTERESPDSPWGPPANIAALNSPFDDHAANLTTDGHWVYFFSTRPGGSCNGGARTELWAAHRKDRRDNFGWDPPMNLGCSTLNIIGADEGAPNFWEDSATGTLNLYFARNYNPANNQGFDIYVSQCTSDIASCNRDQLWSAAQPVTELNSAFRETRSAIRRRDNLEIIISSMRIPARNHDLWVCTRSSTADAWSAPVNLNDDNAAKCASLGIDPCPVINTTFADGAPAISWDGQTMIFYSDRPGGSGGTDLWMTTREKVTGH